MDRVVVCDGVNVGRVYQVDAGQQEGLWQRSCLWVGNDTRGPVETLDEGLEAIKSRVTDAAFPRKSDDTSRGCVPTRAGCRLIGCSARWRDVRKGREVRRREDFTSAHRDRMSDQLTR
jgi:hypothetical protein